jgi:hypothetical protein
MFIYSFQITSKALEQNDLVRAEFICEIAAYRADQLVFVDECYVDKRNTIRLTGWSEKGTRATVQAPFIRGARFSILPALSLDGVLDMSIIKGAINAEIYINFIEGLAMEMNPYPGKNSCLVVDNVRFHTNPRVKQILDSQ